MIYAQTPLDLCHLNCYVLACIGLTVAVSVNISYAAPGPAWIAMYLLAGSSSAPIPHLGQTCKTAVLSAVDPVSASLGVA